MYAAQLGRFLSRDPMGYAAGINLNEYVRGNPINYLDPFGLDATSDREKQLWAKQQAAAAAALDYWKDFLNLRQGDQALSKKCEDKMLCMLRAMAWVESNDGTNKANHGDIDPLQSGNPGDSWWQSLTGNADTDRIIGGPGKGNWYLHQLPAATGKAAPPKGHNDPSFTPDLSYLWGALALIQKMNTGKNMKGGRTYKCGDCSDQQLFDGAVAYNGGGAEKAGGTPYGERIRDALKMIDCGVTPPP